MASPICSAPQCRLSFGPGSPPARGEGTTLLPAGGRCSAGKAMGVRSACLRGNKSGCLHSTRCALLGSMTVGAPQAAMETQSLHWQLPPGLTASRDNHSLPPGVMASKGCQRLPPGVMDFRHCAHAATLGSSRRAEAFTRMATTLPRAVPLSSTLRPCTEPISSFQGTPAAAGFQERPPFVGQRHHRVPSTWLHARRLVGQWRANGVQGSPSLELAQENEVAGQADASTGEGADTAIEAGEEEVEGGKAEHLDGGNKEQEGEGGTGEARTLLPLGHGGRSIDEFYFRMGLPPFKEIPGKPFTIRVRQHVNPLKNTLAGPTVAPEWGSVFEDPSLPLFLDLGCASARLSLLMALRRQPGASLGLQNEGRPGIQPGASLGPQNVLGLEIRAPLVERANAWADQLGLKNAHFLVTNATLSLDALLQDYPGELAFAAVLCPDPQFKKRHRKRRIVQAPLVEALARHMVPGGAVFLQSDVLEVAVDMRRQFLAHAPGLFLEWHGDASQDRDSEPGGGGDTMGSSQEQRGANQAATEVIASMGQGAGSASPGSEGGDRGQAEGDGGSGDDVRRTNREGSEGASEGPEGKERPGEEERLEGEEWEREAASIEWMNDNPLGVPSEREAVVLSKGNPVYRTMLIRK